jgi:hypothetical protein
MRRMWIALPQDGLLRIARSDVSRNDDTHMLVVYTIDRIPSLPGELYGETSRYWRPYRHCARSKAIHLA